MSEQTGKTTASAASPVGYQKKSAYDTLRGIAREREEKAKKLRAELSQYREGTRRNVRQLLTEFQTHRIGVRKQVASAPANVPEEEISPEKSLLSAEKVAIVEGRGLGEQATVKKEITTTWEMTEEEQPKGGKEDLDSRILQAIISASPEGIAISGIRKQIGVPRKKLGSALRKLVEDGKITRKKEEDGDKYFANKPQQQEEERSVGSGEV